MSGTHSPALPAVLVVEDEVPLLDTLRQALETEFSVDTATSAEQGLMFLGSRKYRVILSDHMLPGAQGLNFLIRAAELQPESRRILLTGYINPELLSRSVGLAGLFACLLKPLPMRELIAKVRAAAEDGNGTADPR